MTRIKIKKTDKQASKKQHDMMRIDAHALQWLIHRHTHQVIYHAASCVMPCHVMLFLCYPSSHCPSLQAHAPRQQHYIPQHSPHTSLPVSPPPSTLYITPHHITSHHSHSVTAHSLLTQSLLGPLNLLLLICVIVPLHQSEVASGSEPMHVVKGMVLHRSWDNAHRIKVKHIP